MTKRSPLGVRLLGNIAIFVVSGTILFVITELAAYFHGRQHLQSLSAAARTALVKMKPGQLASRFWSIQNVPSECNTPPPYYVFLWQPRPLREEIACPDKALDDCYQDLYRHSFGFAGLHCSAQRWQACFGTHTVCTYRQALLSNEFILTRWFHALFFLIGDIFQTERRAEIAIDMTQLCIGWFIAFVLCAFIAGCLGMRSFPYLFVVPILGIAAASVASVPTLWIIRAFSALLAPIVPEESDLAIYGATISTICYGCTARATEAGIHRSVDGLIESVIRKAGGH
jgi:hypothetical protein